MYQVLNASATIVRHEQFESFANVFRQHELITSIVINEHYLPDGDDEYGLCTRVHSFVPRLDCRCIVVSCWRV